MVKCFALVFNTFKWFQQMGKIELHTAIHLLVLSVGGTVIFPTINLPVHSECIRKMSAG